MGSGYEEEVSHWYIATNPVVDVINDKKLQVSFTIKKRTGIRLGTNAKGSAIKIKPKATDVVPEFRLQDYKDHAKWALQEFSYRGDTGEKGKWRMLHLQ